MNSPINQSENNCPGARIAAYIDGDLSQVDTRALENHFGECSDCALELNQQKKMLRALDIGLEHGSGIDVPENFTKVVVANAESNVSGLRRPQERFRALFVCAGLFLLIVLGLGNETPAAVAALENLSEKVVAVGGFGFHLIHDFAIGIAVVSRTLCHRFIYDSILSLAALLIFLFLTTFLISRLIGGPNRV